MKIKLATVRLSFPRLFTPELYDENAQVARYDASFMVEPGSANDLAIREAISKAATEKWGAKAPAELKRLQGNKQKHCYLLEDEVTRDEYEGSCVLSTHRNETAGPPVVVDADMTKLTEANGRPYSGCYVNASVDIYIQSGKYPGVRATLCGVQFVADGEAFAGAPATASDFSSLAEGAGADEFDVLD